MIVHLVKFSKAHSFKRTSFSLPTVEDLAFLIQVHSMSNIHLSLGGGEYLNFLSDPFVVALEDLRLSAGPGEELVACHVDLTNAFSSLRFPEHLRGTFRVLIDGHVHGFNCLPFGWHFSPIICQTVLGYILAFIGFPDVLVLHCLDDFLLVGYGRPIVRNAAATLCIALRNAGAIISSKSILEPTQAIVWLGKLLCFPWNGGGGPAPGSRLDNLGWPLASSGSPPLDPQTGETNCGAVHVGDQILCWLHALPRRMVEFLPMGS